MIRAGFTAPELRLALRACPLELVAGDAHDQAVGEVAVVVRAVAEATLLDETERLVEVDRTLVVGKRPQLDHREIERIERVIEQQHQRVARITLPHSLPATLNF